MTSWWNRRFLKCGLIPILLTSCLIWWNQAGGVEVQTRLIFPDLTQRTGVQVGYAVTAANNHFHQVTFTAYGNDGSLMQGEGIENPVELNLSNFGQESLLAADIFNFPPGLEADGWIEVTSTAPELKGFFLTLENGLDRVDGADAIQDPGLLAVLLVPSNAEVDETQIHVVNAGDEVNQVAVRLVSDSGAVLQEAQRILPPRGKVGESLQDLLPMSAFTNDFYVVVEGDQELAAYQLVRTGNSVAGFNGIIPAQVNQLFSPQLATGPGFETALQLTNTSGLGVAAAGAQTVNLEITARAEDGQMMAAATQNPRQISVASGELFQMDAATFFGIPLDELRSGWIEIRNLDGGEMPLSGSVAFGSGGIGQFTAALPLVSEGKLVNTFSHIAQGEFGTINWFTGLAFLFTGEGETEILITVRNSEGGITGRGRTVLSSNGRISQTLPQLIPGLGTQAGGSVQVTSTREVMAFSLFGLADLSVLAAIPTQPLLDVFQPIGRARFEVTVGDGVPAPRPLTLPQGSLVFLNLQQNECAAGVPLGRAVAAAPFEMQAAGRAPTSGEEEDLFSTLLRFKHDSLPDLGDLSEDGEEEIEEFCEYLERSFFSGEGVARRGFSEGHFRAEILRFAEYVEDEFPDARPAGLPAGGANPLRVFYTDTLGEFDLGAENLIVDVPRNDCSPVPTVLVEGNILVPESLAGMITISLNFLDFQNEASSVAFVDGSALVPAGGGMLALPYQAAVPAGNFNPRFRFSSLGAGPTSSGTILLDPVQVASSNISIDLPFPQLIAVTGTVEDLQGNALSNFRSMTFTSNSAQSFSGRQTDFRVLLPMGQEFAAEILRDLRGPVFPAGTGRLEVLEVVADGDKDIGPLQFQDPPALVTTQLEFRDSRGRPIEDALVTAEVIELSGAPPGFGFESFGSRSQSNGIASIILLPGRYRITVDCELCR